MSGAIIAMLAITTAMANRDDDDEDDDDLGLNIRKEDCRAGHCPSCDSSQVEVFKQEGGLMKCMSCGKVFPKNLWY